MTHAERSRRRTAVDKGRELEDRSRVLALDFMRLLDEGAHFEVDDPRLVPFVTFIGDVAAAGSEVGLGGTDRHARARAGLEELLTEWRTNLEYLLRRPVRLPPLAPYEPEELELWDGGPDTFARALDGTDRPRFEGLQFVGMNLRGADLSGVSIIDCRFEHCDLSDTRFGPATTLVRTAFISCDLSGMDGYEQSEVASIGGEETLPEDGGLRLASVVLEDCDLQGANLDSTTFSYCVLRNIEPKGRARQVSMQRAGFTACRFERVSFMRADAYQASFTDCEMSHVSFSLARMARAVFCECTLDQVQFNGAQLANSSFSNSDVSTAQYGSAKPALREPSSPADLRDADFRRAFKVDPSGFVASNWSEALLPAGVRSALENWAGRSSGQLTGG